MNERPTPETDALREAIDNGAAVEAEMTSFAMKLERERDEAREALRELWASADAYLPSFSDKTIQRWRKLAGWEEK